MIGRWWLSFQDQPLATVVFTPFYAVTLFMRWLSGESWGDKTQP